MRSPDDPLTVDVPRIVAELRGVHSTLEEIASTVEAFRESWPEMQQVLGLDVGVDPLEDQKYRRERDSLLEMLELFVRGAAASPTIDWKERAGDLREEIRARAIVTLDAILEGRAKKKKP